MLFTEPCCERLKQCLSWWREPTFHRIGDAASPLFLRVGHSPVQDGRAEAEALVDYPVHFCPFCGKQLQTPEEVEQYVQSRA